MRKLLVYLKDYRREVICAPLFKLFEVVLELLVPLVVASVIDEGISRGDAGFIIGRCAIMMGLGLTGLASAVTAQYFAAKAAVGFATKLRHALFSHIQGLSYSRLDALGSSTMITRMTSDVNQAQSGVNMGLRLLLRSPFVVFGAMAMAFTIDVPSALIFAVDIPLLGVAVFAIMALTIPLYKKVQRALDKVLGVTRGNLTGVRVLRAFRRESAEEAAFADENGALYNLQRFAGRISALMNPLTYVLVNGAVLVLIYTGALRVEMGLLTTGAVVALYNYMSQILVELIKLANLIVTLTKAVAACGRIQSVLDVEPQGDTEDGAPDKATVLPDANAPCVAFEDVTFKYSSTGGEALSHITFTAKRGETIGIIGGTGAGKTTLVSLIPRFYEVDSGRVLVDGVNVNDHTALELRAKAGIAPQKATLFAGTIRENLLWGNPSASDAELWAALETAQAADVVREKAGGLDEPVAQSGGNFSGGQRQRLCVARALVRRPEILILDDSASALDYATDARLRAALRELDFSPTVFIISQRTASIRGADTILVLDDGALVGTGTHEQLMDTCPTYREIHESQYGKGAR